MVGTLISLPFTFFEYTLYPVKQSSIKRINDVKAGRIILNFCEKFIDLKGISPNTKLIGNAKIKAVTNPTIKSIIKRKTDSIKGLKVHSRINSNK